MIFSLMGAFLAANQAIVANIAQALGGSEAEMGYMVSALYLGSMIAVPFEGELAVALGKRKAVVISALMVCVGAVLMK